MCMGKRALVATISFAAALACSSPLQAQTKRRKPASKSALTIDQLIEIKHP